MDFNVGRWQWSTGLGKLHTYTAKLGHATILPKMAQSFTNIFSTKMAGSMVTLPSTKEVAFPCNVYHCAIADNCWLAQVAPHISTLCIICTNHDLELVVQCMAFCPRAQTIWNYALTIIYTLVAIAPTQRSSPTLVWQQCVVGSKLPRQLHKGRELSSLIRGSVAWILWIDCNATLFNSEVWSHSKLEILL